MLNFDNSPQFKGAMGIIELLNRHQFQAYLVGGCVRDCLLQREINDFDIATSALPEDMEKIFPSTIPTGIKFGSMTVLWNKIPYEVTTFRGEGDYSDGRRPDSVQFSVTLQEDLERRDFTINAMAYHPDFGLIDPYQGEIDLEKRLLTTVGDPFDRFSEDYLRILRGLRFSATLGLQIQENTADAMQTLWDGLISLPRERITNEIKKLVMGSYLVKIADFYPVLEEGIFMGIDCLWEADDEDHLLEKLEEISASPPILSLRLALFLSLFAPESAILRLSKEESRDVDFLCQAPCLAWEEQPHFYEMIAKNGKERMKLLFFYQKCQYPYHLKELRKMEAQLEEKTCTSLEELAIKGRDLMQEGVAPGEMLGRLLHKALYLVIEGSVENEKEALIQAVWGDN